MKQMLDPTRVEEIFAAALGKPLEDREAFLEKACADDAQLRGHVEQLLAAHHDASNALPLPAAAPPGQILVESAGTTIGRYKLLEQIGEGGFGVVFMAEQEYPVRRRVALKIIKLGMDTKQVVARFEAERQALAMMEHPSVARVLDVGATETGRPYFVMELVKGIPITQYCDEHHLNTRDRLALFVSVCHAVQHAHQKGIIHRDLKPGNVLVAEYDEKPVPKVIDFGVAKAVGQQLTEKTMFTAFGQVIGTMEYMSPEHARLNQLDIDTRSDIYSLGVILYELLTGQTPFDRKRLQSAAFDEMLRIIREEEPLSPSTQLGRSQTLPSIAANRHSEPAKLTRLVRGELDWIVMKSLEKDRSRRYETANGLAADVQRYLDDEAVQACPPSATYRFRKFARRRKVALAVSGLVLFFLVLLGSGIGWAVRDRTARQARVSAQLQSILQEVEQLERTEQWDEALTQARRAEPALAAGEVPSDVQNLVRQVLSDLELVERLDKIREQSGMVWGPRYSPVPAREAEQDYAAVLRGAGIDVDMLPAKEAAERITARGQIAAAVLPALDDWVAVRNRVGNEATTRRLIDVLRIADPDPWRQRVRECLARNDLSELESLAKAPDLERQPAATIAFLSGAIRKQADADYNRIGGESRELGLRGYALEIDVLRRAVWKYPADYWINRRLGNSLIWLKSPPLVVQEGIGFLRTAVALRPQQSEAMWDLGHGYRILGDPNQAAACYRESVEIGWRRIGNEVAGFATLATQLSALGKISEAESVTREGLAIIRKARGNEDSGVTSALLNLGSYLRAQNKLAEAEGVQREALALRRKALGNAHRLVAQSLIHLAWVLLDEGKSTEAESAAREALAITRNVGLEKNPSFDWNLSEIAYVLRVRGKLAEAESLCREALAVRRTRFGVDHPEVAHALLNLSWVLERQGKPAEAESAVREALVIARKAPGDERPIIVSTTLDRIALLLQARGEPVEAEAAYREILAIRGSASGEEPQDVARSHIHLAWALEDQGRFAEAEGAVREALAINRNALGNEHPELAHNLLGIAYLLWAQGKFAEAEPLCREALTIRRKIVEQTPDDAFALNRLAWELVTCAAERPRDPTQAVELAEKAVRLRPDNGNIRNTLGVARYRAGEFKQAIADLEASMQLRSGNDYDFYFLAMAHWRLGNEEEARKWYDRAVERLPLRWNDWQVPLFRAEAAQVLGIPQTQPATAPSPAATQPLR